MDGRQNSFNRAKPDTIGDLARLLMLGNLLRGNLVQHRRKVDPVVSSSNLATVEAVGGDLPLTGKAASIVRATVRAGGVTGELTPQAYGATPATTQIAVAPNGNIVVLGADAITDMDVVYIPERGDELEIVLPAASNVITLPSWITTRGVVLLGYVEALVGTSLGRKIVLVPGAGAPAAGQARLNVAKTTVTFAAADAVTRAKVGLVIAAKEDLNAVLSATEDII